MTPLSTITTPVPTPFSTSWPPFHLGAGRDETYSERHRAAADRVRQKRGEPSDAYLTAAKESEQVEDRLAEISRRGAVSAADFRPIDEIMASLAIPYHDWETLYRVRLQVENETRLQEAPGAAVAM